MWGMVEKKINITKHYNNLKFADIQKLFIADMWQYLMIYNKKNEK